MRVLGLETSSRIATVAVCRDGRVLGQAQSDVSGAHAERLMPMVEQALLAAGLDRSEIDRVGVGVGPGSFTGVRAGLSVARGIARGLNIPVVGVGSLRALAHACSPPSAVVAVLDARRDEVFVAAYAPDGGELVAPRVVAVAAFDAWLAAQTLGPHVFVGEGVALLNRASACSEPDGVLPHAVCVAQVAAALAPELAPATPVYVRDAGATPQKLPPSPF